METAVTVGSQLGLIALYLGAAVVMAQTAELTTGARRHFWALTAGGLALQVPGPVARLAALPLDVTALTDLAGFGLFAMALLVLLVDRRPTLGIRRFLDIATVVLATGLLGAAATVGYWPAWSVHTLRLVLAPLLVLGLLAGAWTLTQDGPPQRVRRERRLVLALIAAFASTTAFLVALAPRWQGGGLPLLAGHAMAVLAIALLVHAAVQDRAASEQVRLDPRKGPRVWVGSFTPDVLALAVVLVWLLLPGRVAQLGLAALMTCYIARQAMRAVETDRVRSVLERDTRQTAALLEVTRAGSTELDLARALDVAVRVLPEAVGLERAAVWLVDGHTLRWAASAGYPEELGDLLRTDEPERMRRLEDALSFDGPVMRHGPLTQGDIGARFGTALWMLCPMPAPAGVGGVVGVLMLSTAHAGVVPDESDLAVADTVAQVLGQTVANQQLLTRLSSEEERLRELTEALLASQEQERIAVSNAIHDDAVQLLSATAIQMEVLARSTDSDPSVAAALNRAAKRLQDATVRLRALMTRLRPPQLDDIGLAAAIESEARRWEEESGVRILVAVAEEITPDPVADTVLFRTVQESLRNAVRHAEASMITIRVTERHGRLIGEIRDNGRGIAQGALERALADDHVGVQTMHEQVRLVGGSLAVDGHARPGTLVRVTLPIMEAV